MSGTGALPLQRPMRAGGSAARRLARAARATLDAFAAEIEAGALPSPQYAALHELAQALIPFPGHVGAPVDAGVEGLAGARPPGSSLSVAGQGAGGPAASSSRAAGA